MSKEKPSFILPQYEHLKADYDAVVKCNRCGFCETVCPTYVITGKETLSPRGRNQAFRNILEGKLADPGAAQDIFSTCLTCHACTNVCFSQVPVGRLMGAAREISQSSFRINLARFAFRVLLFNRKILSAVLWTAFLLKRTGVPRFLRRIGVLGFISPSLASAEELTEEAPLAFGARPVSKLGMAKPGMGLPAYFSACGIHYLIPSAASATLKAAQKSGPVLCPSHSCCGLIPQSAGDLETARALARKNIKEFSALGVEAVLVNDDSCAGFMKGYGALLPEDEGAPAFSAKVRNLSEFLVEKGVIPGSPQAAEESLTRSFGPSGLRMTRVTYHDPCQMGNGQNSFSSPRQILKSLPGVEFVELEESNWCCGGAGTYALKHPHLADDVLERKLENIRKTGARVVVTQASSCLLHVAYGLRKKEWGKNIRVLHLAEFLSQ